MEASEATAKRFLEAIEKKFSMLCRSPYIGVTRDMLGTELRVLVHKAYAIYYVPMTTELVIVRVLHSARDALAIAQQGGFDEAARDDNEH